MEIPTVTVVLAEPETLQPAIGAEDLSALRSIISPAQRRAWHRARPWPMVVHFLAVWVQIVGALALFLVFPNAVTFGVAFVLVAGGQHGLAMVAHEFTHYLVLPGHRRLNDFLGAWVFSGPAGLAFELYRQRHFAHHRLYSTEHDTKTIYRRDFTGGRFALECLRSLVGLDYVQQAVGVLRRLGRDRRESGPGTRPVSLVSAMIPLVGSQLVIAAILCSIDPFVYLALWVAPLLTMTPLLSKLRSSVEHLPLNCESGQDPTGKYYKATAGPFARSVRASWFERMFLSKVNFCYHNEHHLWPQVSYQYLPRLRRQVLEHERGERGERGERAEHGAPARQNSYLSMLVQFWAGR